MTASDRDGCDLADERRCSSQDHHVRAGRALRKIGIHLLIALQMKKRRITLGVSSPSTLSETGV